MNKTGPLFGPLMTFMGATSVEPTTQAFLQVLADSLVKSTHFRFATTGFRGNGGMPSAAFAFSQSLLRSVNEDDIPNRIFTYTAFRARRGGRNFVAGTVIKPMGRTSQAQRLNLMLNSDVVCLIGGSSGTREIFDLH